MQEGRGAAGRGGAERREWGRGGAWAQSPPFVLTPARVSHPRAAIPAEPLARLPADAQAVINIYFAVTHTTQLENGFMPGEEEKKNASLIHVMLPCVSRGGGGGRDSWCNI